VVSSSARQQPRAAATTRNIQKLVRDGLLRNHIHVGSVNAAPRDFHDALRHLSQLAKDRRPELTALITARVSPDNALLALRACEPQGIKTVVMYS